LVENLKLNNVTTGIKIREFADNTGAKGILILLLFGWDKRRFPLWEVRLFPVKEATNGNIKKGRTWL
jgi:ribosomal protein L14